MDGLIALGISGVVALIGVLLLAGSGARDYRTMF
jgi:hypothetical protein